MGTTENPSKKTAILKHKAESKKVGEAIMETVIKKGNVKKKPEKYIYVGPPTKELPKYAIYEGGLPSVAERHIEKCPALKALFIDPKELTNFQLKLADSNSVEFLFYKKAEEYFYPIESEVNK